MKTIDVKQGTPEWLTARLGVVTASEIDALVSPTGKVRTGDGVASFLYLKIAERLTGMPQSDFQSFAMGQGTIVELEAVPWFAFQHGADVKRAGFCTSDDGRIGFSPDGLIGEDGGLEVKCPQPSKHIRYLVEGVVPDDYVLQIQFSLYVSGRKWWKFVSYSRQLPALVVHVEPMPAIQTAIAAALTPFLARFESTLATLVKMKAEHNDPRAAEYEAKVKAWEMGGPIP